MFSISFMMHTMHVTLMIIGLLMTMIGCPCFIISFKEKNKLGMVISIIMIVSGAILYNYM